MNATQLRERVIRPTLHHLGLWSEAAERQVLGTACKESTCGRDLVQIGGGPALGIFQCEPATHHDIWRWLEIHGELSARVTRLLAMAPEPEGQLVTNLAYATAICRIHYVRRPEPLPTDLPGQAAFWKAHYNTVRGAGTEAEYIAAWKRHVGVVF